MKTEQNQSELPEAYSYLRFSSAKQELGDSLRRQVQMTEDYCVKHNLKLNPSSFRDLGVSAFKQKNIETGALAAFIDAVNTGKIAKGSYLVIEQFDRLSRAEVDIALRLLLHLVHSGITLITLVDEKVWDREAIKDITNLILAIVFMSRANNESASKAKRISEAWSEKKRKASAFGTILTRECPRWLAVNDDKSAFVVLDDKVASIRKVFDYRINLGLGTVAIVNRANKEGWPVPGKGDSWHTSLVGRLLKNRALLGEYHPHKTASDSNKRVATGDVVMNYFPAVLDEETFLRAQSVTDRHGEFPGRRDVNYANWLHGLLRCSCGHSFVRKNKQSAKQPGYARYYCTARNRGLSDCPGVSAKEIESAIIHAVSTIAPQFFNGTARMEELKVQADLQQIDVSSAKEKRDRFADAIGISTVAIPPLMQRLTAAQDELDKAEKALTSISAEIADLAGDSDTVFESILAAVSNVDSADARAELREDLSRVLVRCVVDARAGTIDMYVRGTEVPITIPMRMDSVIPGLSMKMVEDGESLNLYHSE